MWRNPLMACQNELRLQCALTTGWYQTTNSWMLPAWLSVSVRQDLDAERQATDVRRRWPHLSLGCIPPASPVPTTLRDYWPHGWPGNSRVASWTWERALWSGPQLLLFRSPNCFCKTLQSCGETTPATAATSHHGQRRLGDGKSQELAICPKRQTQIFVSLHVTCVPVFDVPHVCHRCYA